MLKGQKTLIGCYMMALAGIGMLVNSIFSIETGQIMFAAQLNAIAQGIFKIGFAIACYGIYWRLCAALYMSKPGGEPDKTRSRLKKSAI